MSTTVTRDVFSLDGKDLPYRVVVPEAAKERERGPGVLYLLHGLFGSCDNWLELTRLSEFTAGRRYITVLPEGEDSWYIDSEANGRFESLYLSELIPTVDARFSTNGRRGVAGNSMGGYGAIKFALRRRDLFKFAISCSGAFHAPRITDASDGWDELKPSVIKAFGPAGSPLREANDICRIVEDAIGTYDFPPLFLDCGLSDEFLQVNREMSDHLKRNGVAYSYKEFEGGHDWEYWDARLESILAIADEFLN
jgi:S-formylglutathione hydrolase FrmB